MDDRFKFRVWDKRLKRYHQELENALCQDGSLIAYTDWAGDGTEIDTYEHQDGCIIEQCTSLKDKNGTLIYEGDIVKTDREYTKGFYTTDTFVMCWEKNIAMFRLCPIEGYYVEYRSGSMTYSRRISLTHNMCVIGNINTNKGQ